MLSIPISSQLCAKQPFPADCRVIKFLNPSISGEVINSDITILLLEPKETIRLSAADNPVSAFSADFQRPHEHFLRTPVRRTLHLGRIKTCPNKINEAGRRLRVWNKTINILSIGMNAKTPLTLIWVEFAGANFHHRTGCTANIIVHL